MPNLFSNLRAKRFAKRAHEHFAKGNWELARDGYTRAYRASSAYVGVLLWRGWTNVHLERYAEAVADAHTFLSGIPLRPVYFKAAGLSLRCQARIVLGQKAEALSDINQAMDLYCHPNYYFIRAVTHYHLGQRDAMIADLHQAAELMPDDPPILRTLARVLACSPHDHERDGQQALTLATRACELTKWNDWITVSVLAAACAECGDFDLAIEWAEKALDLAPPNEKALRQTRIGEYRQRLPFRADSEPAILAIQTLSQEEMPPPSPGDHADANT